MIFEILGAVAMVVMEVAVREEDNREVEEIIQREEVLPRMVTGRQLPLMVGIEMKVERVRIGPVRRCLMRL